MINKFVNIKIDSEGNIGVIDLGMIKRTDGVIKTEGLIKKRLEPKLVKALSQHFDCPVKIRHTEVVESLGTIKVVVDVIIESDSQDYEEIVKLDETWVY